MYEVDNASIGKYLKRLIERSFPSHRQFCRRCLEKLGRRTDDEELRKMGNRLSQILKGVKGVQITDLPVFSELLGVSCEEILSAGNVFVRPSSRITNYDVAYCQDPKVWKEYVAREDKLILNSDEYCKTILDYIFEAGNYKFLKYLLDENIIWLTRNERPSDTYGTILRFGAGTAIKKRSSFDIDSGLERQILQEDRIRARAITLAIENGDYDILDHLAARDNTELHLMTFALWRFDMAKHYDADLVHAVANADGKILEYFSLEFDVKNDFGEMHRFIFPFIGNVVDLMLKEHKPEAEVPLRAALDHNKKVFQRLFSMLKDARETIDEKITVSSILDEEYVERCRKQLKDGLLDYFQLSEQGDAVYFSYKNRNGEHEKYGTNLVQIKGKGFSPMLKELVDETNRYYQMVIDMKGATNGR